YITYYRESSICKNVKSTPSRNFYSVAPCSGGHVRYCYMCGNSKNMWCLCVVSETKDWESKIGIFEGRKAVYNTDILEVLLQHGRLTSWGIAKQIQKNKRPSAATLKSPYYRRLRTESDFYCTQIIYGTIARKGGRLQRLHEKQYILLKDEKWELNPPKADAILLKKP
ncbi:unnamed protein product, partial [marine sediment metagenome]